jgi:CO/xanthine dehydrogenase Mo-binding subunit
MSVTGNRALSLYRAPNLRYEARAVYTNLAVAGAYRGYGCPQGFFALESHVDEVAHALGEDPIEFRRRNHVREGDDQPIAQVLGEGREGFQQIVRSCGLPEAIRLGARDRLEKRAEEGALRSADEPHLRHGVAWPSSCRPPASRAWTWARPRSRCTRTPPSTCCWAPPTSAPAPTRCSARWRRRRWACRWRRSSPTPPTRT